MPINVNFVKLCLGYILAIFPIFLLIGPLVSELSLLILIIFSIYFILKEKKLNFLFNRFFVFFVLFYISTLFSTLINFYNLDYSKSAIFYIRLPLFAIGIWYILENFDIFNKKITLHILLFFQY